MAHAEISHAQVAQMICEEHARVHGGSLSGEARADLEVRIALALKLAGQQERTACIALCQQRHALWRQTEDQRDRAAALREEARHRANEAAYLADALHSRR